MVIYSNFSFLLRDIKNRMLKKGYDGMRVDIYNDEISFTFGDLIGDNVYIYFRDNEVKFGMSGDYPEVYGEEIVDYAEIIKMLEANKECLNDFLGVKSKEEETVSDIIAEAIKEV